MIVPCDRSRSGHAGRQTHAFERGRALASSASHRAAHHPRKDSLSTFDAFSVDIESDGADRHASPFAESTPTILDRPHEYVDDAEMGADHLAHKELLWKLSSTYLHNDVGSLQRSLVRHVEYTLARRRYKFDKGSFYQATAHSVRDRLIERWTDTQLY